MIRWVAICLCMLVTSSAQASIEPLKVGIMDTLYPFSFWEDGQPKGLAAEIFQILAPRLKRPILYVPLSDNIDQGFYDLNASKIDVLVGPLPVNTATLNKVSFSRPFFVTQVVALRMPPHTSVLSTGFQVLVYSMGGFFGIMMLISLFGLFLHYRHEKTLNTYADHHWIARFILITGEGIVRLSQAQPLLSWSKPHTLFWTLYSLLLRACFLGTVLSIIGQISQPVLHTPPLHRHDIHGKTVGYIPGSEVKETLLHWGATPIQVPSVEKGLALLKEKKIFALAGIRSAFKLTLENTTDLRYAVLHQREIAFASRTPELTQEIDRALISIRETRSTEAVCEKYVGPESYHCDL